MKNFFDLPYSYTDEQEWDYIYEKTGYNYDFIKLILWERYCYEKGPLLFKEKPNVNYTEKLVCHNCGYEMQIGENGVF